MKQRTSLYPDYVANSCNDANKIQQLIKIQVDKETVKRSTDSTKAASLSAKVRPIERSTCVTGVAVAYCDKFHMFYKPVFCGREHCPACGKDGSQAHKRRVNRVIDTVLGWASVSYLVVTVPEQARPAMCDRQKLNDFRTFVRRKLKRDGFTVGLFRWHWAGSCRSCKGNKNKVHSCSDCNGTGAGNEWEPHLNILLPAGNTRRTTKKGKIVEGVSCYDAGRQTLKKSYIDQWREDLRKWFKVNCKIDAVGNIHHNFVGAGDKMRVRRIKHKLKYVMRATLRDSALYDKFADVLKNYRTTTHLGVWAKVKEKQECECPLCGGKLNWYGESSAAFYNAGKKLVEVKSGMYYLDWTDE